MSAAALDTSVAIGQPFGVSLTVTNCFLRCSSELTSTLAINVPLGYLPPALVCLTARVRLGQLGLGQTRSFKVQMVAVGLGMLSETLELRAFELEKSGETGAEIGSASCRVEVLVNHEPNAAATKKGVVGGESLARLPHR